MILITKTSDQTRQRVCVCVFIKCVCVFYTIPFILNARLVDAPAGVTQDQGRPHGISQPSVCDAYLHFYLEKHSVAPFIR